MPKQVQVWQTDRGDPASSYADALMGDAADAVSDLADKAHTEHLDFDLYQWLLDNHVALLPLLQQYADAKAKRHAEIHGDVKP